MKDFQICYTDLNKEAKKDFLFFCQVEEDSINMEIPLCSFSLFTEKKKREIKWTLIDSFTRLKIVKGANLTSYQGENFKYISGNPPHKSSSTGKVHVKDKHGQPSTFYPGVFKLEWIQKEVEYV